MIGHRTFLIAFLTIGFILATFTQATFAQRFRVDGASFATTNANPTGLCPVRVNFTGTITVTAPGTVRYQFLRSDGATGAAQELNFAAAGTANVTTDWQLGTAGSSFSYNGWIKLRIISPTAIESAPANFSLSCTGNTTIGNIPLIVNPGNIARLLDPGYGEFEIVLTGFTCNHHTDDKFLDEDGAKDEIYVRTDTSLFDYNTRTGTLQPHRMSHEIGDTNHTRNRPGIAVSGEVLERIRGGSATNIGGANGGFQEGDSYPTSSPWGQFRAQRERDLPMLVWRGTLKSGEKGLVIIPSIWESDENPDMLRGWWNTQVNRAFSGIGEEVAKAITDKVKGESNGNTNAIARRSFASFMERGAEDINAHDRPVGLYENGDFYVYAPKVVVLTYEAATRIAGLHTQNRGDGMFTVRFNDGEMNGDYTLYFHVERVQR